MDTKLYIKFLLLVFCPVLPVSCSECGRIASVSPNEVQQGDTDLITISTANTSLQEMEVEVVFVPSDGIEFNGPCSVVDETELECSISIAEDAMVGMRSVVITYNDCVIAGANEFAVAER